MKTKDLEKKLNKRNKSKNAWNNTEYIKYKEPVESARIEAILGLISEFNNWSILSDEEEDHVDKIKKDLKNYLKLLYKINAELKNYLNYLEGE